MMSRGFITNAQFLSNVEDADPIYIDLRITDSGSDYKNDRTVFVIEIENSSTEETILLTRDNAAALAEALREILKRYPEAT